MLLWVLFFSLVLAFGAILSADEEKDLAYLEHKLSELRFEDSVKYCQLKALSEGQAPEFCAEVIKKYRNMTFQCLPALATEVYQLDTQKNILIGRKKYKHITFGKNMKGLDFKNVNKNIELIRLSGSWEEIFRLIENAKFIGTQQDKSGNPSIFYHTLENMFWCNQKKYKAVIIIKESAMGLYLYDVDLQ